MNAEGATSGAIGSVGSNVAVAAPISGSAIGAGIGAEIRTGIGFDAGSPTFSGLERMDASISSFSVNEGPIGPVSFTNSIDLFAETKPFIASAESVAESPADVFLNTEIIAQDNSYANSPAVPDTKFISRPRLEINAPVPEPISIFDNTSPFQVMTPVNEGPTLFSLKDTFAIAKPDKPTLEESFELPEISVESALESYIEAEPDLIANGETVAEMVKDLKINDPLTAAQLETDLASVRIIADIASQVTDKETAARIVNSAIDTAVDRAGIIEEIQETQPETEAESTEPETEAQVQNTSVNVRVSQRTEEEVENNKPEPRSTNKAKEQTVRDEKANKARIEDRKRALEVAIEEKADPNTGKVKGKDVLEKVVASEDEQSELAKKAGVNDGSIPEADRIIGASEFDSAEAGEVAIFEAVNNNTGVKEGTSGTRATPEEEARVLSGKKAYQTGQSSLPLAS